MDTGDRVFGRRVVLGGAAAGVAGVGLSPALAGRAGGGLVERRSVDAVAARLDRELIELRRDIHRHPEAAGQERRTAAVVAGRLRAAGLEVTTGVGGNGVVGVLTGAHRGRTVAYRADMDAVPPDQQIMGGPDTAHLCGHDLHTTIGVGVAEVLARLRDRLAGTVVFVFQPAEEALSGAAAMLGDGVFDRVRPVEIHGMHCGPFPVGQFVVTGGFGLPGLDRGTVTVTGPDAAARARRLAADIGALGTVSPPSTSAALEQLVADLLTPDGPLARFVFMRTQVPDGTAQVEVSYRCWPVDRYVEIRADISRLAESAGGASVDFPNDPFPGMVSPERESEAVERYLRQVRGRDGVRKIHAAIPFNGEDFALFLDLMPGTFTFLGVRAPGADVMTSYPHFGVFDPDERAIGYGVRAMAGWLARRTRG
jgi:metal-dependent amidase/aminoacylase/carboxypeptidase family protein